MFYYPFYIYVREYNLIDILMSIEITILKGDVNNL